MQFQEFKAQLFESACFSINQVYAWRPDFDHNNLTRWIRKGYLIRLRQGLYSFPEYSSKPGYPFWFANRIYRPSYISLHSALSFYGLIPESVIRVTSVTSLKTASFSNGFGSFSYNSLKENLMFGYLPKNLTGDRSVLLAQPEKALLDLLYLYPFYQTGQDLEELRLDEELLHNLVDKELLQKDALKFRNKALEKRVSLLLKVYSC